MKNIKKLFLMVLLGLVGCSSNPNLSSSLTSQSDVPYSSTTSQVDKPVEESSSSSLKESSSTTSSTSSSSSNKPSSSSSSQSSNEPIPARGENLPIGNKSVSGPSNTAPIDISGWVEYEFNGYMPDYWSYIQGNNKVKNGGFYADGSVKFAHLWYGVQTPLINSWKKIEVRMHISQVNNCSDDGVKDDQPIFHIYGYDKNGYHISTDYLNQGSITKQKEGSYVQFYVRNTSIAYLEFRLNANPVKGSQHYNFGVNKIDLKGWDYE